MRRRLWQNRLSEAVERLRREHQRLVTLRHGRRAEVPLSADDQGSLEETLEILRDPELLAAIREAEAEVHAGRTIPLTKHEALALVRAD